MSSSDTNRAKTEISGIQNRDCHKALFSKHGQKGVNQLVNEQLTIFAELSGETGRMALLVFLAFTMKVPMDSISPAIKREVTTLDKLLIGQLANTESTRLAQPTKAAPLKPAKFERPMAPSKPASPAFALSFQAGA